MPTKRKRPSRLYLLADAALFFLAMPVLLGFIVLSLLASLVIGKAPWDTRWDEKEW